MPRPVVLTSLLAVVLGFGAPTPGFGAQDGSGTPDPGSWNAPATLELVDRGREARAALAQEGDLDTYRSLAEGHVYFFLDPERGERALIRIDQVAVEIGWQSPGRVRQRIVGERSDTRLPVREFDYYMDRVTLVPYGFGDEIRVGSGMDVSGVPHPLALGESRYDFRLADSLTLTLPGRREPVRLYELDVRPRAADRPGAIGTLTLDGASGQIVRMALTFTPASYIDPRTDWISVELEYGLWDDRYWLPNVQRIEVRREVPEIDLGIGTVIRSVLRVGEYELNVPREEFPALGARVSRAPADERLEYSFREGLHDGLRRDGLAELRVDSSVRELRAQALERVDGVPPSALSPVRLHLPGPSALLRYSRTEGAVPGIGGTLRPTDRIRFRGLAGYAIGARHARADLTLESTLSRDWTLEAGARHRTTDDLGLATAIDPLLSSLAAATRGEDYRDPFLRTGATASLLYRPDRVTRLSLGLGVDRVRSARLASDTAPVGDRAFRPVRPVADGTFTHLDLGIRLPLAVPIEGRGRVDVNARLLSGGPGRGIGLQAVADTRWGPPSGARQAALEAHGWHWWGDPLPQGHRLLGGRGTLPGFPFRAFAGRRALTATAEASSDAGTSHLRLRAGLHAGWTDRTDPDLARSWDVRPTSGVRASGSVGVGLLWDLLRIDVARGLNGGEWQLLLAVDPAWWDRL